MSQITTSLLALDPFAVVGQAQALVAHAADQPWVADLAEVVTRRRRRSGGGISIFGCCCLLLLAVAAGVVFLVWKSQQNKTPQHQMVGHHQAPHATQPGTPVPPPPGQDAPPAPGQGQGQAYPPAPGQTPGRPAPPPPGGHGA